jgi:hypothetical protein
VHSQRRRQPLHARTGEPAQRATRARLRAKAGRRGCTAPSASAAWKRVSRCALRGRAAQTGRARVTDAGAAACSCGARQPRGSATARMLSAAAQPCAAAGRAPRRVSSRKRRSLLK